MSFLSLIEAKRDGQSLPATALQSMVQDFVAGKIPDYQMAAMLMAIYFRGLSAEETRALTLAMRGSGEALRFPEDPSRPVVDKHSTGGVGDKVSLVLAPLLACLGFRVPMISGRGLGITGGTLDKMESIPGFSTCLEPGRIIEQVQNIGVTMAGQTAAMVPADRLLYALRDVTGTVPSIPLITASILSKKLAEDLQALILDVKVGGAAFMQTQEEARTLARSLVAQAKECGVNARALLTNMETPLGRAAGNWLEVKEAVACLEQRGPPDLQQLVVECAASLLVQTGRVPGTEAARDRAEACLATGAPRRKWNDLLCAQGADLKAFEQRLDRDHLAPVVHEVRTPRRGYVTRCDARQIGGIIRDLGAGRLNKNTPIQPDVGVDALAKPGEQLEVHSLLCRIHASSEEAARQAAKRILDAFRVADVPAAETALIHGHESCGDNHE